MMKKSLLLFCFVFCAGVLWAQPSLKLEVTEQNAGKIPEQGGVVIREYRFTNAGDVPLVIVDSKVSCTCTKVDFPKKPVMPGQSGVVTVKYDPRKQPAGKIYKAIQLFSNDPDGRHVLVFRGEVVR